MLSLPFVGAAVGEGVGAVGPVGAFDGAPVMVGLVIGITSQSGLVPIHLSAHDCMAAVKLARKEM